MFSSAYKLINSLWSTGEEVTPSVADDVIKYPSNEGSYITPSDGPASQPTDLEIQSKCKQIRGTITHIFGDYGLIDNDIYFSLSSVLDRACPVIGASIQAVVENYEENQLCSKQAISVSIINDWFDDNDELKDDIEEVQVGKVTTWDKRVGTINEQIEFTKDALPYDFKPYRGDWVKVTVVHSTVTGKTTAKVIKPLRERNFAGELTHAYPGYGFIDGNIYFSFAACNGFRPQKGDWLTGVAIESDQNRGKWRGMKVQKRNKPEGSRTNVEDIDQQPQVKWKEELFRNKCGVIVSEIKEVLKAQLDEKLQLNLEVKNTLGNDHQLKEVKVTCFAGVTTIKLSVRNAPSCIIHPPLTVSAGTFINVDITLSPRYLGRTVVIATFQFEDFAIGREIPVVVLDSSVGIIVDSMKPVIAGGVTNKYRMERWKDQLDRQTNGRIMSIAGQRPTRTSDYNVPVKLPGYPVSKELQSCVMNKKDVRDVRPVLTEPLMMENYSRRFSALLHLEEIQMDIDIRIYDMERVSMKPWREYLALEVPGLAEKRPSVLVGDKIILSPLNVTTHNIEYDGFVHEVHGEHVLLKFNPAFHECYQAERYNVRFTFSRTPHRRCHQACEFAVNLGVQVLFPASSKSRPPQVNVLLNTQNVKLNAKKRIIKNIVKVTPNNMTNKINHLQLPMKHDEDRFIVPKVSIEELVEKNLKQSGKRLIKYFNKSLNSRQKAAVVRILQGESRPIPYVLFGPPGTGKTITVVEAILQVNHHLSHSRVLACTPSNSAADLLAQRLHASDQVTTSDMVRLNAFRRHEESVPEDIIPYCTVGDNLALVARHRIIVTTCTTAGTFYQLGLKAGHFTHVFVDEAGQATEPEAMVVIALSVGRDGQSILAGDPRQLGPVLRSDLSKSFGFEQSLLERLMDREAYQRDEKKFRDHGSYDPLLVTKLVDNYRSHPALLKLSSQLFYHGELEPRADRAMRERLCKWTHLPNQEDFPLMFHGIKGQDLKEGNSPSWFNPVEAVQAVKYLQALLADNKYQLTTDDIGIITPYRKQVEKIKLLLTSLCILGVKVGSVEEFQGQERQAIIISTVRSDESLIDFDAIHRLGFVSSPKRFNVAITRPKALLVIVGNPHVLAVDSKWRSLLQYCSENNGYIGCELPDFTRFQCPEDEYLTPVPLDHTSQTKTHENILTNLVKENMTQESQIERSLLDQVAAAPCGLQEGDVIIEKEREGVKEEGSVTSTNSSMQGISPGRAVSNLEMVLGLDSSSDSSVLSTSLCYNRRTRSEASLDGWIPTGGDEDVIDKSDMMEEVNNSKERLDVVFKRLGTSLDADGSIVPNTQCSEFSSNGNVCKDICPAELSSVSREINPLYKPGQGETEQTDIAFKRLEASLDADEIVQNTQSSEFSLNGNDFCPAEPPSITREINPPYRLEHGENKIEETDIVFKRFRNGLNSDDAILQNTGEFPLNANNCSDIHSSELSISKVTSLPLSSQQSKRDVEHNNRLGVSLDDDNTLLQDTQFGEFHLKTDSFGDFHSCEPSISNVTGLPPTFQQREHDIEHSDGDNTLLQDTPSGEFPLKTIHSGDMCPSEPCSIPRADFSGENIDSFDEFGRNRTSYSSMSPKSSVSSRSLSPAFSDPDTGEERRRRRRTSTSSTKTTLACNFQKPSQSEEEKRRVAERFIKGKGRGLIVKM